MNTFITNSGLVHLGVYNILLSLFFFPFLSSQHTVPFKAITNFSAELLEFDLDLDYQYKFLALHLYNCYLSFN